MAIRTFKLPDPGEGLVEAEIVEWKVAPGDTVKVNDMVLEVETAKSLVELPIPWAGTVKDLLVEVGDTVDVGTAIITIDDGQGGDEEPAAPAADAAAPAQGRPAGGDPRRLRRQGRGDGTSSPQTSRWPYAAGLGSRRHAGSRFGADRDRAGGRAPSPSPRSRPRPRARSRRHPLWRRSRARVDRRPSPRFASWPRTSALTSGPCRGRAPTASSPATTSRPTLTAARRVSRSPPRWG